MSGWVSGRSVVCPRSTTESIAHHFPAADPERGLERLGRRTALVQEERVEFWNSRPGYRWLFVVVGGLILVYLEVLSIMVFEASDDITSWAGVFSGVRRWAATVNIPDTAFTLSVLQVVAAFFLAVIFVGSAERKGSRPTRSELRHERVMGLVNNVVMAGGAVLARSVWLIVLRTVALFSGLPDASEKFPRAEAVFLSLFGTALCAVIATFVVPGPGGVLQQLTDSRQRLARLRLLRDELEQTRQEEMAAEQEPFTERRRVYEFARRWGEFLLVVVVLLATVGAWIPSNLDGEPSLALEVLMLGFPIVGLLAVIGCEFSRRGELDYHIRHFASVSWQRGTLLQRGLWLALIFLVSLNFELVLIEVQGRWTMVFFVAYCLALGAAVFWLPTLGRYSPTGGPDGRWWRQQANSPEAVGQFEDSQLSSALIVQDFHRLNPRWVLQRIVAMEKSVMDSMSFVHEEAARLGIKPEEQEE